jgi:hypothetical protein
MFIHERRSRKTLPTVPGRSPDWLKMKNADAPVVKREAEENWGNNECGAGRRLKPYYDLRHVCGWANRIQKGSPNEARLAPWDYRGNFAARFEKHCHEWPNREIARE